MGGSSLDEQALDQKLTQMLNDLRNTLLGVQVLLAGLVTVAFAPSFAEVSRLDEVLYLVAILGSACASALLIAPGQYHRIACDQQSRPETLRFGRWMGTAGSACLAVAVVAIVGLLTDVVAAGVSLAASVAVAVLIVSLWFVLPATIRARELAASGPKR